MSGVTRLEVQDLKVVSDDRVLVNALSFSAGPGEIIGLTGPSGAGKTGVLHAIGGLAEPASGRVLLGGEPVCLWRERQATALVLQNLWLLPVLTAHETVALPLQARGEAAAASRQRADAALAELGLLEHRAQLLADLSGGQRQRVALARALAAGAQVILADEPTSALDPHWRSVALEQLTQAAAGGAIVILASSDPELIGRCARVIRLGDET